MRVFYMFVLPTSHECVAVLPLSKPAKGKFG